MPICPASKSRWSLLEEVEFYLWMRTSMCISLGDMPLLDLNDNSTPGYWCSSNPHSKFVRVKVLRLVFLSHSVILFSLHTRGDDRTLFDCWGLYVLQLLISLVPCLRCTAYFPLAVALVIVILIRFCAHFLLKTFSLS